ncbi:isopeptide-forming domain-containing fimbrial protein [Vagococcus salmoninarum]|uniref:isopeptide-forming domain-containing fimbrial protein n=1 Tax=Vagococcus salmoninarum TaxID=2739 RepID=UPI003F9BA213
MKKTVNILIVITLLFYYLIVPVTALAESEMNKQFDLTNSINETMESSLSDKEITEDLTDKIVTTKLLPELLVFKDKESKEAEVLEFYNTEKIIFKITQKDLSHTEFILPQGFQLVTHSNQKKSEQITYDEKSRNVLIIWNDEQEEIDIELETKEVNYQEKLEINGFIDDEKVVEKKITLQGISDEKEKNQENSTMKEPKAEQETELESESIEESKADLKAQAAATLAPFAHSLNIDVSYTSKMPLIDAGVNSIFLLEFKVTGSVIKYEQVDLAVKLPTVGHFNQNLEELTIAGVTPQYNQETNELLYHFETLKTGQTYKTVIKIQTENGTTLNGTVLKSDAVLSIPGLPVITETAQTVIQASTPFAMSKVYLQTYANSGGNKPKTTPPLQGDYSIWKIKANVGKNTTAALFLKEGSKIVIKDTLPINLNYVSASDGGQYNNATRTITWEFTAPTIAEQKLLENSLFSKELTVETQFATSNTKYYTLENKVSGTITDLADRVTTQNAAATINLLQGDGDVPPVTGTIYLSQHIGPRDGKGNLAPGDGNLNPVPTVYDTDLLKFGANFYYSPSNNDVYQLYQGEWVGPITNYNASQMADQGFKKADIVYKIDNKIRLENFSTAVPRDNAYTTMSKDLVRLPEATYSLKLRGQSNFLPAVPIDFSIAKNAKVSYTRDELKLSADQDVSEIKITYLNAAPRTTSHNIIEANFSIKKGARGQVSNSVSHEITSKNGTMYHITGRDSTFSLGNRQAMIATPPVGTLPIGVTSVSLVNQENGIVTPGQNRLKVVMKNDKSSQKRLTGPLTSYVLLPEGMTLANNPEADYQDSQGVSRQFGSYEKISDSYLGTGQQLIKVHWTVADLIADQAVLAFLNVDITESAPLPLTMGVYSYSQDIKLSVPSNANPGLRDTFLDSNSDLMGSGYGAEHDRVRSGNRYTMINQANIQTEKLVKGQLDDDFSLFGKTLPGGRIDYQLKLTNTSNIKITTLTLMDVLPSVGDLGITDNVMRESKFTPLLIGPITLPSQWADQVEVFYSTATNPKRDDLTANVVYPEGSERLTNPVGAQEPNWQKADSVTDWEKIHSYKVQLKKDATWVSGEDITLNFTMRAPLESELTDLSILNQELPKESRAAWNSFALAVNDLQAVEPARVGVSIELEKPSIHKNVEDLQHLDLKNRHQSFTWNIETTFGNSALLWETAEISDQINDLLEIESIEIVDEKGQDVSGNGTLTSDGNLVNIKFAKKEGSYSYLVGEKYILRIKTKIRQDVTAADLEPFIKSGGIPNQADLIFGHSPEKIVSEIPTVTPPELVPLPDTGGIGRGLYLVIGCLFLAVSLLYFGPRYRKEVV